MTYKYFFFYVLYQAKKRIMQTEFSDKTTGMRVKALDLLLRRRKYGHKNQKRNQKGILEKIILGLARELCIFDTNETL